MKLRPIFKDIFLTFITQVIVFLFFFLIYQLIAKKFGPEGVGEYSLVKRVIGLIQPVILLGLAIGLPRYIAMSKNQEQRSAYVKMGSLIFAISLFIVLILINIFKKYFVIIFFGNTEYVKLILPFSFYLGGLTLHSLVYSVYRGKLLIRILNLLQIINIAVVPALILIFFNNITIEDLITFIGIATLVIALLFSLYFLKEFFGITNITELKRSFKELTVYSLPRFPAVFIWNGFLAFGPIFASHVTSLTNVGYLSVSQNLLYTMGTAVAPLGLIFLPKISSLVAEGRHEIIKQNINILIGAVIYISTFISFQLIIFGDIIIKYWLGQEFVSAVPIFRITFLAIVFYTFYEITRNILDAVKIKPITTINLSISLTAFIFIGGILLCFCHFIPPIITLGTSFTIGIIILGILTYAAVRAIYPEKFSRDLNYIFRAIGFNVLFGGAALLLKGFVVDRLYYFIIFEIILGILYLIFLWLLKIDWIREIPRKILLHY